MGFEILGHFLFKGGWNHYLWSGVIYHQMLLHTRNKAIYGLGVGISMVFDILGQLLFMGDGTTPYGKTYLPSDAT
jgi:hypothetical protein